MDISSRGRFLLRAAGLLTVAAVAVFLPFCSTVARPVATVVALALFIAAFWLATGPRRESGIVRVVLIGLQSVAAIGLLLLHPYFLMASLLVVVGWQAALWLSPWQATALVVGQSMIGGLLLSAFIQPTLLWPSVLATVGFQIYGLAAAAMARGEATARAGLATALGDLRAAQASLAERTRAEERLRIARDLHDELGHGLTALDLELGDAWRRLGDHADVTHVRRAITGAKALCGELLDRLKVVVADMRGPPPAYIDLGAALRDLVATSGEASGPRIFMHGATDLGNVDLARATVVLRAAQEAVTNSRRHSVGATRLDLQFAVTPSGAIRLTAADDGRGSGDITPGAGLSGMCERASAVGGAVRFERRPDAGFHLTLELPGSAPA